MNSRLCKARRVLCARIAFDRMAEWRLDDLERRKVALQNQRGDLMRFLDGEAAISGLFAASIMRRLHDLEASRAALAAETEAQAERRRDERARMRCAERIVYGLETEIRRELESRALAEAVESSIFRRA